MRLTHTIRAADMDFVFSFEVNESIRPNVNLKVTQPDTDEIQLICLTIEGEGSFTLSDLQVEWSVPIVDMNGLYWGGNPTAELSYLPFWHVEKHVCANTGVPY